MGLVGRIKANQVENTLLREREILRGIVLAYGAAILTDAEIEDPVKPVLYSPVGADRCRELLSVPVTGADVIAPL